jgi:hypothetical protein
LCSVSGTDKSVPLSKTRQIRRFWLRQNDDAGLLRQNDDAGLLRQNDDAGLLRQNDDAGLLRQNDDAGLLRGMDGAPGLIATPGRRPRAKAL